MFKCIYNIYILNHAPGYRSKAGKEQGGGWPDKYRGTQYLKGTV